MGDKPPSPWSSQSTLSDESSYLIANRLFWTFLYLLGFFRLAYIIVNPLPITDEEAYLWDYGRRMFTVPGLEFSPVAWLTALLGWLGQDSLYLLRIGSLLIGSFTLVYIFRLTRRIYNPWVGFWTITALVATPGNAAQNFFLSVEGILLLCWVGTLYGFWRVITLGPEYKKWIGITLLFFVVGLTIHVMMLSFACFAFIFLLTDPVCRKWLRGYPFWLIAGGGVALSLLVLTLLYTPYHEWTRWYADTRGGYQFSFRRLIQFSKDQMWLLSPVTWLLVMTLSLLSLLFCKRLGRPERYLMLFSSPGICLIVLTDLFAPVFLDLPTTFYVSGIILIAGWSGGLIQSRLPLQSIRAIFHPGIVLGAFWTLSAYLIPFGAQDTVATLGPPRYLRTLEGWEPLYERAQTVRQRWVRPSETFFLSLGANTLTSRLAFSLPGEPLVYRLSMGDAAEVERLWAVPLALQGQDAVIVVPGENAQLPPGARKQFREMVFHSSVTLYEDTRNERAFTIYLGIGYQKTE